MISWLRPSKSSASVRLPPIVSKIYCLSTFTQGRARRCSLRASRAGVSSFSFASNSLRATVHSSRVTTWWVVAVLVAMLFSSILVFVFDCDDRNLVASNAAAPLADPVPRRSAATFAKHSGHIFHQPSAISPEPLLARQAIDFQHWPYLDRAFGDGRNLCCNFDCLVEVSRFNQVITAELLPGFSKGAIRYVLFAIPDLYAGCDSDRVQRRGSNTFTVSVKSHGEVRRLDEATLTLVLTPIRSLRCRSAACISSLLLRL